MPFFYFDYSMLLLIPALIVTMWAQYKVSSSYRKYSQIKNKRGYTGAQVARLLLNENGMEDIQIVRARGELTDHYDPSKKILALSEGVYDSTSIAALSIAAHETGHALQDHTDYIPLNIRTGLVPVVNMLSQAAMPVFLIGLLFGGRASFLLDVGIYLFLGAVIFQIVTLPVEFNASRRAISMLSNGNYLYEDEIEPAKGMLASAALTYVAAALMTLSQLFRLIFIRDSRSGD